LVSSQAAIDNVIFFLSLDPGSKELLAVMRKDFDMRILHPLTRLAKNNTAGADVIRDRACYSSAPMVALPAPGPQR
jgi:hypothetical protein